ncbi:MAG TPA: rhodanese-like domain-containing protein [Nitratifractor sp.]|nr:rhodanese-like domain-containing protein [Nitratifractor sp.]
MKYFFSSFRFFGPIINIQRELQMKIKQSLLIVGFILMQNGLWAAQSEDYKVKISEDIPYVDVDVLGTPMRIDRIQDTKFRLKNSYTKTSRPCPPFCVQPFEPIKGIETYGEIEVLDFLKNVVTNNEGVVVDARLPKWYKEGTIPGAINLPFSILNPDSSNVYLDQVLPILGAVKNGDKWDFANSQKLMVFDNGPWCQQGVRAMKNLLEIGYPKDKVKYYRGGMQYWQILGLKVYKPKQ